MAIDARGIGKRYALGQLQGGYGLLTESITNRLRSLRSGEATQREEFWALQEVDFQVDQGETVGIIGHNGAGKSTLLKILSRITPPTAGEVRLRGRVGALLEVGTGFHPELTGRENVFLNGAILGMSRVDILRNFAQIVEFAGVEQFIDTPVKRYSSGMQLRLAFSVAAHLEPEVLIVDEVLSVGDLAFQEKCLGRIEKVAGEGRTVLFVSHNLTAVRGLCDRAMMLDGGRKVAEGETTEVIDKYVHSVSARAETDLRERSDRMGTGEIKFVELHFEQNGRAVDSPVSGEDVDFVLGYEIEDGRPMREVGFTVLIATQLGELMLHLSTQSTGTLLGEIPAKGRVRCRLPKCPLPAGQYMVTIQCDRRGYPIDWVQQASQMTVTQGDFFGSGRQPPHTHRTVLVDNKWSLEGAETSEAERIGAGTT